MDGRTVGELGSYGITAEAAVPVVRALNFLEAAGHEVGAAPSFAYATRVILLGMAILVVVFAFRVFGSRFLKK
jgi:hypothetical protein